MGIYRLPFSQDTWVNNEFRYGSGGRDPILDVGVKYSSSSSNRYIERILGKIDTSSSSDIKSRISLGQIPDPALDATVTAKLKMFNVLHAQRQARSFILNIFPVTQQWDEGSGLGFGSENFLYSTGYANYVSRKVGTDWTVSGGDYLVDSNSAVQEFDNGSEDLNVDITNMFKNWISGISSNNGFIVKVSDLYENTTGSSSASLDLWRKSFFGRETSLNEWPRVEVLWDDQIKDYRSFFTIGGSGYTYFYNMSNERFIDLASTGVFPGYVAIEGATSNSSTSWISVSGSLSSISAQRVKAGIYKALIKELPYNLYNTYTRFRDKWVITSAISAISTCATSTIIVISPFAFGNFYDVTYNQYTLVLRNFQKEYQKGMLINLRVFIKDLSKTYETLTASSTAFSSLISDKSYWRILTNKDEVDIDWQPLDFDKNGNFLTLDTSNLTRNFNYKIDFKINIKGQDLYFDGNDIPSNFKVI